MPKLLITIALALVSIFATNYLQASQHKKQMLAADTQLEQVQTKLDSAKLELAVTKVDLAASNAVITRQNSLIAAYDDRLKAAQAAGATKLAVIRQASANQRAKATSSTNYEIVEAVKAHLIEFCNG